MYFDDKDFDQKVRFQKVLWSMGMWSRVEIPIVIYEDDTKADKLQKHYLTDIDVYGELIQPDFSFSKTIGDCKSGKNVKIFERLFWVFGVKEYLHATEAYIIKRNISTKAKVFMPRVGVKGIDDNALKELEKIYHSSNVILFSQAYYTAKLALISQLKDEYKKIYDYTTTRYWFTDLHTSMRVLLTMLDKNNFYSQFRMDDIVHRFLLMETILLFSRSIIDCCRYVVSRDVTNVERCVLEYIHGGVEGYNSKSQMVREIINPLQEVLGADKVSNMVLVKPPYFNELTQLVTILIGEASNIRDIIRVLEIMQHEIVLGQQLDYSNIVGIDYSAVTHKIAKDLIAFYFKCVKIDVHFFNDLLHR